jgi:proprotein convertase subtilisin/kexin type 5
MLRHNNNLADVMHEFMHILGQKESVRGNWIDVSTNLPYVLVATNQMIRGVNTLMLLTPNVVATAITHFDCPTLIGLPL